MSERSVSVGVPKAPDGARQKSGGVPSKTERDVFVVGYMHSGTTLLRNMLAQSQAIFAPPGETHLFEELPRLRSRFPDLRGGDTLRSFVAALLPRIGARDVLEEGAACNAVREGLREGGSTPHAHAVLLVLDAAARAAGAGGWLEKTPAHVFHLDAIFATRPGVRVVEVVRDLRDVLASKKTRRETVWTTERYTPDQRREKHLEKAYDPLWDTLSWKAAVKAGKQALQTWDGKVLRVRYEDLVCRPREELQRICMFIDVPFEDEMLDVSAGNAASWTPQQRAGGVRSDSQGRWKSVLDPSEVCLAQWLAADAMTALGYVPEPIARRRQAMVPLLLLRSLLDISLRLYRRLRWKGAGYVWVLVTGYVRRLGLLRKSA